MLSFLTPYKLAIEIAVFGILAAGVIWCIHLYNDHQQTIGYQRAVAEYTAKLEQAKADAKAQEDIFRKQLEDANNAAAKREQTIRTSADAARAASASLSDALNNLRNSVPGATAASLANSVATLATVLGNCSERYRDVAEKADRHASDAQRILDSWPKAK